MTSRLLVNALLPARQIRRSWAPSSTSIGLSRRFLATQPTTQSTAVKQEVKVGEQASTNELNKPEWERSDRYKIFFGFDFKDEAADKGIAHSLTFMAVLFFFVLPFMYIYYYPDYRTADWCYREAYLELSRREAAGEPLVSPDYVSPSKIKLPTEAEIGDMEIVI